MDFHAIPPVQIRLRCDLVESGWRKDARLNELMIKAERRKQVASLF